MHPLLRPVVPVFLAFASAASLSAQAEPNLAAKAEPRPDQIYWHNTFSAQARKGDLDVIDLGDLADADRATLREAAGYFLLAEGRFGESSYSHLWVAP